MGLSLVVGPANAGKVALLLDRYSALAERDPVLVVPNRAEAERIELELLERAPTLFGGSIGTFDDLFDSIAFAGGETKPAIPSAQRRLLVAQVVSSASLNGLAASARFPGFADALGKAIEDASEGLLDPDDLEGPLGALYARYLAELERLGRWDRPRAGATPRGGSRTSWTRGAGDRSSSTASRTSPAPSGCSSKRSPAART